MPDLTLVLDLTLMLLAALLGGIAASALRQPPVVGYLLAGLLLGPHAVGLVKSSDQISFLADFGVAFLMFTLGVEFNLRNLTGMGKTAVVGTIIQIISSILFALPLIGILNWSLFQAIFVGALLSLSSTAIVVKVLADKGKLDTVGGTLSTGWLLTQDLAVLPLMILLPILSGKEGGFLVLVGGIFKAVILLGLTFYLGNKLIPKFLNQVVKYGREVLLLSLVVLTLGIAFLTYSFGLSFAIGAFLAGLIVSETEISEEALAQVKSLRDLFLTLFFVSVGMLLNPFFIIANFKAVLLILVLLILGKFIPIFSWIFSFGYHAKIGFLVAIYLLQIGEFSFVLGKLGVQEGLITDYHYNLILSVAMLSIVLTPFFISEEALLFKWFKKIIGFIPPLNHLLFTGRTIVEPVDPEIYSEHVILLGYGRVGKYVSQALKHVEIPHVVIEVDPKALKAAKDKGLTAFYGDGAEMEVLEKAGLKNARALVLTHPDQASALLTIYRAKKINPHLKILARAHRDLDVEDLKDLEIEKVVQPEFEASVSLMHKLLDSLGVEEDTVRSFTEHIRRQPFGR